MHCIQFRPSLRFFQGPHVAVAASDIGLESSDRPTPVIGRTGLLSKEDRLAHAEALRSVLVHVIIPTEIASHIVGGDHSSILSDVLSSAFEITKAQPPKDTSCDLELVLSLSNSLSVSQAVSVIFETLLDLREKTGRIAELHKCSLYSMICDGLCVKDVCDSRSISLGLLQSDLTLGVSDAAGNVLQLLKRLFVPKAGPPLLLELNLPNAPTVTQIANYFQNAHCNGTGMAPSQKTMLNILTTFVPNDAHKNRTVFVASNHEAAFQPPFYLKLFVPHERVRMRKLQLKEAILRERLVAHFFALMHDFFMPYFELVQRDVSFRTDWIMFQSHCRHRLHISERENRIVAQQRVVIHEEAFQHQLIAVEEESERFLQIAQQFEQLTLSSCGEASRKEMVLDAESLQRQKLEAQFAEAKSQVKHLLALNERKVDYRSCAIAMEEDSRLAMLRAYHIAIQSTM